MNLEDEIKAMAGKLSGEHVERSSEWDDGYAEGYMHGLAVEAEEIVDWLESLEGADRMMMPRTIAEAIKRGDHNKTAANPNGRPLPR